MTILSTVTTKGQVTIPQEFRDMLNIKAGQKVAFSKGKSKGLNIKPIADFVDLKGIFANPKIKYDKKKARKAFIKDVIAGKI